jgi:hypothetical protein
MSRVTTLGVQDLTKNVVDHIVVRLQPNCLSINTITIQVHVLVLIHSKGENLRNGGGAAILVIQTKKASKGRKSTL